MSSPDDMRAPSAAPNIDEQTADERIAKLEAKVAEQARLLVETDAFVAILIERVWRIAHELGGSAERHILAPVDLGVLPDQVDA